MNVASPYLLFLFLMLGASFGSNAQLYREGEKYRAGIKAGIAWTTLSGDALQSKGKSGFHTGLYYRQQIGSNKKNHLLSEGDVAFRGARYDYGIDRLDRINLVVVETPVQWLRTLKRNGENSINLLLGASPSAIIHTEAFARDEIVPRTLNLPVRWFNATAITGIHLDTYYVGLQLALKYSIRNIWTDNPQFEYGLLPNPAAGRALNPLNIEFAVYF